MLMLGPVGLLLMLRIEQQRSHIGEEFLRYRQHVSR